MADAKLTIGPFLRWTPALGTMGIIFLVSSISADSIPALDGWLDILVKKSGHLLIYGVLGLTLLYAIRDRSGSAYRTVWAIAVLYAITDEYHQLHVPGRGAWVVDVAIDSLGAGLGLLAAWIIRNRRIQDPRSNPDLSNSPGPRSGGS